MTGPAEEEEEDLASLLQSARGEQPALFLQQPGSSMTLTTPTQLTGGFGFPNMGLNPYLATVITQQQEQNRQLLKLLEGQTKDKSQDESKRKREEISYHPQDPVVFQEDYKIDDDAHGKLDTVLRQRLWPINVCPKEYWIKGAFRQVERPIIGASIFLEHIMPGAVNEATLCKHHDR